MTRRKTATASLPSEVTNVRHWRTREDPFSTVGTGAAANQAAWPLLLPYVRDAYYSGRRNLFLIE